MMAGGVTAGLNGPGFKAMRRANVQPGEYVRVSRLADAPATGHQTHGTSQWSVERISRPGTHDGLPQAVLELTHPPQQPPAKAPASRVQAQSAPAW